MNPQICQELIQFHKSHRHLTGVGDGSDYTGIRFMHIHTPWVRKAVAEVIVNLTGEIRKISNQIVYPEMIALNEWPIGGIQHPHLDTYSNAGSTPPISSITIEIFSFLNISEFPFPWCTSKSTIKILLANPLSNK